MNDKKPKVGLANSNALQKIEFHANGSRALFVGGSRRERWGSRRAKTQAQ